MKILPEPQLIVLTQEALGVEMLDDIDIREYIAEIICDYEYVTFKLKNGGEVVVPRRRMSYSDPSDSPNPPKKKGPKPKKKEVINNE